MGTKNKSLRVSVRPTRSRSRRPGALLDERPIAALAASLCCFTAGDWISPHEERGSVAAGKATTCLTEGPLRIGGNAWCPVANGPRTVCAGLVGEAPQLVIFWH